jgi:hypothetical protein
MDMHELKALLKPKEGDKRKPKTVAVAKLAAARKCKREQFGKCEGRKSHREKRPEVVALAHKLRRKRRKGGQLSLPSGGKGTGRPGLSQRAWEAICGQVCGFDAAECLSPLHTKKSALSSKADMLALESNVR